MCFSILVFGQNTTQLQTRSIPPSIQSLCTTARTSRKTQLYFPLRTSINIYTSDRREFPSAAATSRYLVRLITFPESSPPPPRSSDHLLFGCQERRRHSEAGGGGRGGRNNKKQGRLSEGKERMRRGGEGKENCFCFFSPRSRARTLTAG